MNRIKYKPFKYKGKVFELIETEFASVSGFRYKVKGIKPELISINKNLLRWRKQLELHRLITGKGLRDIRTKKMAKY